MSPEEEKSLKDAVTNYATHLKISREVFTKKASEILEIPIDRVEVRHSTSSELNSKTLTVFVYDETDKEKAYYRRGNGSVHYEELPTNIYDFEKSLKMQMQRDKEVQSNKEYIERIGEIHLKSFLYANRDTNYEDENLEVKPKVSTDLLQEIIDFRKAHKNYPSTTHTLTFSEMLSVIDKIKSKFNKVEIQMRKDSDEVHIHISNN